MKNDKGYVPINRFEIQESNLYPHGKFSEFEAFLDLLLNAAHSETSFKVRGIEVKLKRGQIGYSFVTLATKWNWDRKTVRKFIKETLKKEENVDSKPYPKKNPVTTIITINSYDHYVRNFGNLDTKRDTKTDSKTDIERDTFNNYENYENYKKNEHDNDIPENPGCNETEKEKREVELSEKEAGLIDAIISWAYDPDNNFLIEMPSEKTREQIENTIKKHGHDDIESIFLQCSEDRIPWDYGKEHKSAYGEFWASVQYLKDSKESEKTEKRIQDIIAAVNEILKTHFDSNDCESKNLRKLLSNNANGNDIVIFLQWFKKNGFKDGMTLDDIFLKENWKKFLANSKSHEKNLAGDTFQTLADTPKNLMTEKAKQILAHLNEVTGKNFTNYQVIVNQLLSGRTIEDHIHIIDTKKHDNWFVSNGYMRPDILFGENFDSYVNQRVEDFKKKNKVLNPVG